MRNMLAVTLIDFTTVPINYQKTNLFYITGTFAYSTFHFFRFLQTVFTQKVMQVDIFLDIEKPRTVPLFIIYRYLFKGISYPQAPDYTIRAVSNFLKNSRRYLQLKVHHQCR
jgi:hypothetical protein